MNNTNRKLIDNYFDIVGDKFLDNPEWKQLSAKIIEKYGERCVCCGAFPTPNKKVIIEVDHIKPRKTHPELAWDVNNLQVLCSDCNSGKGDWLVEDFKSGFYKNETIVWED